jgi:hypothetical protein
LSLGPGSASTGERPWLGRACLAASCPCSRTRQGTAARHDAVAFGQAVRSSARSRAAPGRQRLGNAAPTPGRRTAPGRKPLTTCRRRQPNLRTSCRFSGSFARK